MSNVTIPTDRITEEDTQTLVEAYTKLMGNRSAMLGGLSSIEESFFDREILVDSLIFGLMRHLQDVANNQESYAHRLEGHPFAFYVDNQVSDLTIIIGELGRRQISGLSKRRAAAS